MVSFRTAFKQVACLIIFSFSVSAQAAELKFISMDIIPWAYLDKDSGEYAGIFSDIVKELEKRTEHKMKITLTPYVRINRELETGRQDCTILVTEKDRDQVIVLGETVLNLPVGVVANKKFSLKEYDDLYDIKISVLRGSAISEKFNSDEKLRKSFDTDYKISLRKILHGRLDAVAGAIPTIKALAEKNGMGELLGEPLLLNLEPIYLQCSRNSKNLSYLEDLNKAVRHLKESGEVEKIIQKYWRLK